MTKQIRNIAIVAHVDHGKTTLVDSLLKQSGLFRDNQETNERMMDSNDLEKERGITILSKCTSIMYNDVKINIIDTPGHTDFRSEVENVLSMSEGVVLLVDAKEGIMSQTKFVTKQAVANKLPILVVVNKIDRDNARSKEVQEEVLDFLFGLDENLLETPVLYGSGRMGIIMSDLDRAEKAISEEQGDIKELFDKIISEFPAPKVDDQGDFKMRVSIVDMDPYFGRILIGKVVSGSAKIGDKLYTVNKEGQQESFRLNNLFQLQGIKKIPTEQVFAGDIVAVPGSEKSSFNDTISTNKDTEPMEQIEIEPPTLSIEISANSSPIAGKCGDKLNARQIKERLKYEDTVNIGINVVENGDTCQVFGRGELQLSILVENMRREGYEFTVGAPQIEKKNGQEPYEEVIIDVPHEFIGIVGEKMRHRGGQMTEMIEYDDHVRLIFHIPSRLLLGYTSEFLSDTRGNGVLSKIFLKYDKECKNSSIRKNGVMLATEKGTVTAYALDKYKDRGMFFVEPGDIVYEGMIIGEHNRENDIAINIVKSKQLTNFRTTGSDGVTSLQNVMNMTFEKAITFINDQECIEVTPKYVKMRKKILNSSMRKKG